MTLNEAQECLKWICDRFGGWRPREHEKWIQMLEQYDVGMVRRAICRIYPDPQLPAGPRLGKVTQELQIVAEKQRRAIQADQARRRERSDQMQREAQAKETQAFADQIPMEIREIVKMEMIRSGILGSSSRYLADIPVWRLWWSEQFFKHRDIVNAIIERHATRVAS